MGRRTGGDELKTQRLRRLVETEGQHALAELVEDRLDELAGPHRLTDDERETIRACRRMFGQYDPTSTVQRAFVRQRDAELAATA